MLWGQPVLGSPWTYPGFKPSIVIFYSHSLGPADSLSKLNGDIPDTKSLCPERGMHEAHNKRDFQNTMLYIVDIIIPHGEMRPGM